MARINDLSMTTIEIITSLADGNPGAVRVMIEMLENGDRIDPDSALGGLGAILSLDTHGIYGSRIWMLYKDVCGEDVAKTLASLRAVQLGVASHTDLVAAIDGKRNRFDPTEALQSVRQRLPAFASTA